MTILPLGPPVRVNPSGLGSTPLAWSGPLGRTHFFSSPPRLTLAALLPRRCGCLCRRRFTPAVSGGLRRRDRALSLLRSTAHPTVRVDLCFAASLARPQPLLQLGFAVLTAIRVELAFLGARVMLSGSSESCWGCCARRGYGLVAAWRFRG
jgi:hypothetical protein